MRTMVCEDAGKKPRSKAWGDVPVPYHMRNLDRDRRGYPIPVNVLRDDKGRPQFTVNDERIAEVLRSNALCAICGGKMIKDKANSDMWLVGGMGSCFHEHGRFFDSPMHRQCAAYAIQVCPYLSMPIYSKRIGELLAQQAEWDPTPEGVERVLINVDLTQLPGRPEVFGLCRLSRYELHRVDMVRTYIEPKRPWLEVEFWRHGVEITPREAWAATEADPNRAFDMNDLIYFPKA